MDDGVWISDIMYVPLFYLVLTSSDYRDGDSGSEEIILCWVKLLFVLLVYMHSTGYFCRTALKSGQLL